MVITRADGKILDRKTIKPSQNIYYKNKIVAATDDQDGVFIVTEQDELGYKEWLANGGNGSIFDWISLRRPLRGTIEEVSSNILSNLRTTDGVPVSGNRPIDIGHSYEKGVVDLYRNSTSKKKVFRARQNGKYVNLRADNVIATNAGVVAIEAKYIDDWSKSIRNPNSRNGYQPWAIQEQQQVIQQAISYSVNFHKVIYHTNSREFAIHYTKLFNQSGIDNFEFVITPAIK